MSSSSSSSSLDDRVLSFTGDVCEDGTFTVILILLFVAVFVMLRVALSDATARHRGSDGQAAPAPAANKVQRLAKHSWLEDILVVPFVPTSLENFVLAIYCAWFAMTITMGVTRYYEKRWANDVLAQQGLFNTTATFMGCKGLDMDVIPYQWQEPTPVSGNNASSKGGGLPFFNRRRGRPKSSLEKLCEANPLECSPDIDFYFSHHLFFGIVWLSFGALQIYLARNGWSVRMMCLQKLGCWFVCAGCRDVAAKGKRHQETHSFFHVSLSLSLSLSVAKQNFTGQ